MPDSMSKTRRQFRTLRRNIKPPERISHARAIARHLMSAGLLLRSGVVAAYLANDKDGELDTAPLLARLWSMGKRVAVPVVFGTQSKMDFFEFKPQTPLVTNRFGIREPAPGSTYVNGRALTIMLLPLVAFDDAGIRIGMGGGYYDRFLGNLPTQLRPRLIGIAHEVQRCRQRLKSSPWDVPLDDVVTENGWHSFSPQHIQ